MAVIENLVDIDRSAEEVFDYVVDLRNELQWNPDVESMEKITEGPIGVGTKFRAKWKTSSSVVCECREYERPRCYRYWNGGPVEVDFQVSLEPVDGRTRLRVRFEARPHGFFRVIFPLFLLMMKRQEKQNVANLRARMERRPEQSRA